MSKTQTFGGRLKYQFDSLGFSSLAWTFKMLPSIQAESSTLHARPFTSTFQRPAYGFLQ